jgi:hypothetical protein
MAKIQIRTTIDITNTGVRRPDLGSTKQFDQYRNYTTFLQVFGIRSIFSIVQEPKQEKGEWTMVIETDREDVYLANGDPIALIKQDFDKVPIITGLDEIKPVKRDLIETTGKNANTFVTLIQ